MTSLKSRRFNFLMRNEHLFLGKLKKEVFDENTSIKGFRERCEKGARKYSTIPQGVTINGQFIEGMKSEWLIPKVSNTERLEQTGIKSPSTPTRYHVINVTGK